MQVGTSGISIRAGGERDWPAMRMLLPQAFGHGAAVGAMVAEEGRRVVGVAALSPRLRSEPMAGARVAVHVVGPYRRRGIGRGLLAAAEAMAARRGARALYAWEPVLAGGDEIDVYRRMGFDQAIFLQRGKGDVGRSYAYLKPLYDRIVRRGLIPRGARIVGLHGDDAEPIAQLHVAQLGGLFMDVFHAVRGEGAVAYHPRLSQVLMLNRKVVGFSLVQAVGPGIVAAGGIVIDPALRAGWANIWLKFAGACACQEERIHTVLYYTYDLHGDTRNLAKRVESSVTAMAEPYKVIAAASIAGLPPDAPRGRNAGRR